MGAFVAPAGTVTVKDPNAGVEWLEAATLPNFTENPLTLKLAPVTVTLVPTGPKPGENP